MEERILIKACLNGSTTRAQHPAVPISPDEIGRAAATAVAAGAGALHVHALRPDGAQTLEPATCDAVVAAIRRACPDVPVGLSTIADAEPDVTRRIAHVSGWRVKPDFVSVNVREDGIHDLCRALIRDGVGIEAGLWSTDDADRFLASRLPPRCLRVLIEPTAEDSAQAVAVAHAISARLEDAGVTLRQVHHGNGFATWAVLQSAIARGHDIRIGLEDTTVGPDGARARDNAELVALAVRLCREVRPVRSPGPAAPPPDHDPPDSRTRRRPGSA